MKKITGYPALLKARKLVENRVKNGWDIEEKANMQYVLKKDNLVIKANLSVTTLIKGMTIHSLISVKYV